MFGASNTGGFGFGSGQASSSGFGFGATSSPSFGFGGASQTPTLFGANTNVSGFGGASQSAMGSAVVPATGTANPQYAPIAEKDQPAGTTSHFHSISAMPAYKNFSFEELRLKDYEIGRKPGVGTSTLGTPGGFNLGANITPSPFGAPANPTPAFGANPTPAFGASGGFGAQSNPPAFGAAKTTAGPGFGASGFGATTPGFGANTGLGASSMFGASQNKPQPLGFGAAAAAPAFGAGAAGGGFGAQTGAFGAASSSLFGAATTTSSTSLFPKPATTASSLFGQSTANTAQPFGGGGSFGFAANKTTAAGGLFQPTSTPITNNTFGGLGSASQQNTGFGLFGSSTAASTKPPAFNFAANPVGTFGAAPPISTPSVFNAAVNPTTSTSPFSGFNINKPAATTAVSAFSLSTPAPAINTGFSLGSSSLGPTSLTQNLTTQSSQVNVEQSPYGNISILNTTTPAASNNATTPATATLSPSHRKKPMTPHYKFTPRPTNKLKSKVWSSAFGGQVSTSDIKPPGLHIWDNLPKSEALSPDALRRPKKLVLDNEVKGLSGGQIDLTKSSNETSSASGASYIGSPFKSTSMPLAASPFASTSATPDTGGSSKAALEFNTSGTRGIFDDINSENRTPQRPSISPFKTPIHTPVKTPTPKRIIEIIGDPSESPSSSQTPSKSTSMRNGNGATSSSLKQNGYWMNPPLDELLQMDEEELKHITDFQVGRTGCGQVTFDGPVDLSNVPLAKIMGDIIVFEDKVIQVYGDKCSVPKTPIGEGLNVSAKITLQNCWALNKATRQPVKDHNDKRYRQRIQRLKDMKETEFIDFYADTGSWMFRVAHFSKYGLELENDDDAYEENLYVPVQVQATNVVASQEPKSKHTKDKKPAPSKAFSESLRLDGSAVYQMTNAIFPDNGEGSSNLLDIDTRRQNLQAVNKRIKDREPLSELLRLEVENRRSFEVITPPPIPQIQFVRRRPNKFRRINYPESISFQKDGYLQDAGLAMSRSFRVGWGPNGTIVHCGKICGIKELRVSRDIKQESEGPAPFTCFIEKIKMFAEPDQDLQRTRHQTLLRTLLKYSKIESDENGIPFARVNPELSFETFIKETKIYKFHDHEKLIWQLNHILHDELYLPELDELPEEIQQFTIAQTRKKDVCDWLANTVKDKVQSHVQKCSVKQDKIGIILALLTGHEIGQATVKAIANRDFRLATLIPQLAGCDEGFRRFVSSQIDHWQENDLVKFIPWAYFQIFQIMAGNVTEINISEQLDWKRSLGMHLWYGTPLDDAIATAFDHYEYEYQHTEEEIMKIKERDGPKADLELQKVMEERTTPPFTWYDEDPAASSQLIWTKSHPSRPVYDVLYHILKFWIHPQYQSERTVDLFLPRSITSSPLDYRVSWFLYLMLTRVKQYGDSIDPSLFEHLTLNFIAQLERLGLWYWAIFVALHLENSRIRQRMIQELLNRYLPLTPNATLNHEGSLDSIQKFLVEELSVSPIDIAVSKVIDAKYHDDTYNEVLASLDAGQPIPAHDLLMKEYAPEAILLERFEFLSELLGKFDSSLIPNWRSDGGLYLQICSLFMDHDKFAKTDSDTASPSLYQHYIQQCHEILNLIQKTKPKNRMQERCFSLAEIKAREVLRNVKGEQNKLLGFLGDE